MSKIFEEALADAKKLREVAEDNAKKAILESVTPKIREFIEEQLLESKEKDSNDDDEKSEEDDKNQDEQIDEATIKSLLGMIGGTDIFESLNKNEEKSVIKKAMTAAASHLSNREKQKIQEISNKINQNIDKLESYKINNKVDTIQENNSMSKNEKYYEIDLKMLREAVEQEAEALEMADLYEKDDEPTDDDLMNELKVLLDLGDLPGLDDETFDADQKFDASIFKDEDEEDSEGDDDMDMDIDMEEPSEEEPMEEPSEEEPSEEEPPEGAMNEVFDVDPRMLRQELAKIRHQLRESKGKMDHHFGGKGGGNIGHKNAFGGTGPKKAGVKNAFGGGAEGKDPFVNPPQINKLNEAIRKLSRMNRSQTEKLNKYRSAVQTLREQLEDLNLFNAKLLYVNKLLQNKALSESQKKSVIKALDEAKNISETKALYKSLTESLSSPKGNLNESTRFGSSSRVTTSASGNTAVGELDRWQILAGLKK